MTALFLFLIINLALLIGLSAWYSFEIRWKKYYRLTDRMVLGLIVRKEKSQ